MASFTSIVRPILIGLVACAAIASGPAFAAPIAAIDVEITTGADDLRGGGQLTLLMRLNGEERRYELNRGQPLVSGSRRSFRLILGTIIEIGAVGDPVIGPRPYSGPAGEESEAALERGWWRIAGDSNSFGLYFRPDSGNVLEAKEEDNWDFARLKVTARAAGGTVTLFESAPSEAKYFGHEETVRFAYPRRIAPSCVADADCSDGVFCNGSERCLGRGGAGADARGCKGADAPACPEGVACIEAEKICRSACTDSDGDGRMAAWCGGDDCDDGDADRYPGNPERLDAANHDEDCRPETTGFSIGALAAAQVCDGANVVIVAVQPGGGETFTPANCLAGTVCVPQPDGEGVCMTAPSGYQTPARFSGLRRQDEGPSLRKPAGKADTLRRLTPLTSPIKKE